jgi:hypothetical protein
MRDNNSERLQNFQRELDDLPARYTATLTAEDHYPGYAECGSDIRITVEFDDIYEEINLGRVYSSNRG